MDKKTTEVGEMWWITNKIEGWFDPKFRIIND
jgi:hypothetical protein